MSKTEQYEEALQKYEFFKQQQKYKDYDIFYGEEKFDSLRAMAKKDVVEFLKENKKSHQKMKDFKIVISQ